MKSIKLLLIFTFLIVPLSGNNTENLFFNTFTFDSFMTDNLPGAYFPGFFLENFAPDVTLLVEENNGFSHIDNPRVYFEGESYINFSWYYDGFKTDSALDPGRSAILFPFSMYNGYSLKGHSPLKTDYGLHFNSTQNSLISRSKMTVSSVFSNLGSYTPLGPIMIQPEHPSLRDEMLNETRRKIDSSYFIDYMFNGSIGKGNLSVALNHYYIKRDFNDFNERDTVFSENGKYLLFGVKYQKPINSGYYEILTGFNSLTRDNLWSELGRLPEETVDNSRNSFFTGFKYTKRKIKFIASFMYEGSENNPFSSEYTKDIFDNDGDDIVSTNKYGKFSSKTLSSDIKYSLLKGKLSSNIFGSIRFTELSGKEYTEKFNTFSAFDIPYRVILWDEGLNYKNTNLKSETGVSFTYRLGKKSYLSGKLYLNYTGLNFENSENNLNSIDPGFDLAFHSVTRNSKFMLSVGRIPGNIRENTNAFLERSSKRGSIYSWNDLNNDGIFQSGETGNLIGYTGGAYHFLDDNFKNSYKNIIMLTYSTKISANYFFNLKAMYKRFYNNPWIKYRGDFGEYENVDGVELYFYDKPIDDYYLSNYTFEKDPFYAQLLLNFTGRVTDRWFFSFSFMAHMGMGYTSFGNGANSNDIGILSENMADPNTWLNGFGRVDGDRGFVSKVYFGYYLSKRLFLGVSIKYRDGDPFAFLNNVYRNDQWVLYYSTIQAEDEKGIKGGPREDYVSDISLKLKYSFDFLGKKSGISLSFFNILDFGSELSEYVFSGGERYSTELQIPKSLRLSFFIEL